MDVTVMQAYNQGMETFFGGSSGHVLADRRYDMAIRLGQEGDFAASADMIRQALEITASWPPLYFHLGGMLAQAGDTGAAMTAYKEYLALDPEDSMGAIVKLVIMGGMEAPQQMPAAYVQSLFDQYAPRYEESLVTALSYDVPEKLAQAVRDVQAGPYGRVLDLGCGTGLAAMEFVRDTDFIEGVDLSPEMIALSHAKNIYAQLHVADIAKFLSRTHAPFNLILCADVLIYIGALDSIFRQCATVLQTGGVFAFSVQSLAHGDSWALLPDHRYGHAQSYLETCIEQAGMKILSMQNTVIRQDGGRPVHGTIFVCRKTAA